MTTPPPAKRRLAPRHGRFLLAFGLGVLVGIGLLVLPLAVELTALIAANTFFLIYLLLMLAHALASGPADLKRHAEQSDEGVALIVGLALFAVAVSLGAIVMLLNRPGGGVAEDALSLAAAPLGWAMVHTLAAFHYAHLHYGSRPHGMMFPGTETPGPSDFLYISFTIGMTAQVSDVAVTTPAMRRAVLAHSVASFFYNTVILALAVNAALRFTTPA